MLWPFHHSPPYPVPVSLTHRNLLSDKHYDVPLNARMFVNPLASRKDVRKGSPTTSNSSFSLASNHDFELQSDSKSKRLYDRSRNCCVRANEALIRRCKKSKHEFSPQRRTTSRSLPASTGHIERLPSRDSALDVHQHLVRYTICAARSERSVLY